jgi:hypothetical protein
VDERLLERLHELGERASLRLNSQSRLDAVTDRACQLSKANREVARGGNDLTMAQVKGRAPAVSPSFDVRIVCRPSEVLRQLFGDIIEVQRCIEIVPAQHLEGRQIVAVLSLGKMREANLPLIALTIV